MCCGIVQHIKRVLWKSFPRVSSRGGEGGEQGKLLPLDAQLPPPKHSASPLKFHIKPKIYKWRNGNGNVIISHVTMRVILKVPEVYKTTIDTCTGRREDRG